MGPTPLANRRPGCYMAGERRRALTPDDGEKRWRPELLRRQVMSLTDAAAARVRALTEAAGRPIAGLRVGVKNGGCAGMSCTMELADDVSPLDEVVEDKGVKLLIDPKAILFLLGAEMDFAVDTFSATSRSATRTRLRPAAAARASRSRRRAPRRSTPRRERSARDAVRAP